MATKQSRQRRPQLGVRAARRRSSAASTRTSPASGRCCRSSLTWSSLARRGGRASAGSCCCRRRNDELEAERNKEPTLKTDYRSKLAQAVNLGELRKQKLQVEEYVTQLEKQLPGKAEMDALLSDINQAGLGRGLQFELFRPGPGRRSRTTTPSCRSRSRSPAAITTSARSRADVANLSRIVTLHNLNIVGRARSRRHAVDGGHRAHLPLPRRRRSRRSARPRGEGRSREPRNERVPSHARRRLRCSSPAPPLAGCGGEQDELQQWMEQQKREVKPSVAAAVAAEEVRSAAVRRRSTRSSRSARRS